jgi:hypothetical protein
MIICVLRHKLYPSNTENIFIVVVFIIKTFL